MMLLLIESVYTPGVPLKGSGYQRAPGRYVPQEIYVNSDHIVHMRQTDKGTLVRLAGEEREVLLIESAAVFIAGWINKGPHEGNS